MLHHPTLYLLRRLLLTTLLAGSMASLPAQAQVDIARAGLPDAPEPQQTAQQQQSQPQSAPAPAPSTSAQPAAVEQKQKNSDRPPTQQQDQQRILGMVPMFNVVNGANIPPLTTKQKFHLFWKSTTDPYIFGLDAVIAGIGQAEDSNAGFKTVQNPDGTTHQERWGFQQGVKGYFQRYGTTYADTFDGNFWGNAVLTSLLKEDPRFFRMGTGSVGRRFLWAASTTIWCRRDNGKWGPNYANVAGNFIGGAISNLYYPSEEGGFEKTTVSALTVTAEGTFGGELLEFWPDIQRHFFKKKHQ